MQRDSRKMVRLVREAAVVVGSVLIASVPLTCSLTLETVAYRDVAIVDVGATPDAASASNGAADGCNCATDGQCDQSCDSGINCPMQPCACPSNEVVCRTGCTDLTQDPSNCGGCAQACASGAACVSGTCVCGPSTTRCPAGCAAISTDAMNCGGCGHRCAIGQNCVSGACVCATGETLCGGVCVDLATASDHCGSCSNRCLSGETCTAGACTCPTGQLVCGGTCAAVDTAAHCGSCANDCGPAGTCTSGVCSCIGDGNALCGAQCYNLASDPTHCGACGLSCGTGGVCTSGVCSCPAGVTQVAAGGGSFRCVDTRNDPANCGSVGVSCQSDQACTGGSCSCRLGLTATPGGCVDTQTDALNCGSPGYMCPAGSGLEAVCIAGVCRNRVACAALGAGWVVCDLGGDPRFSCVNVQSDPLHCGACDQPCAADEVCVAGGCRTQTPAIGCTSCPCVTGCAGSAACCPNPTGPGVPPVCVSGGFCP